MIRGRRIVKLLSRIPCAQEPATCDLVFGILLTMPRIIYTVHALEKFKVLRRIGWRISRDRIRRTIKKPRWAGTSKHGQFTALSLLDGKHILRVIYDKEGDIIKIITFHPARRGKYESTL